MRGPNSAPHPPSAPSPRCTGRREERHAAVLHHARSNRRPGHIVVDDPIGT
ncbi:hypothetical protein LC607_35330 [Nostoc sp. CHAB 5824]|nr:hypothetical protein [Nostoc sp. CHAB 5824]